MKKQVVIVAGMFVLASASAFAASDIQGALINQSNAQGAANIAIGKDNTANMGSTNISGSAVKGAVINRSNAQGAANIAIGKGNEANMGSVTVK